MDKYKEMWTRLHRTLKGVYVLNGVIPGLLPEDPDGIADACLHTTIKMMEKMEEEFDV